MHAVVHAEISIGGSGGSGGRHRARPATIHSVGKIDIGGPGSGQVGVIKLGRRYGSIVVSYFVPVRVWRRPAGWINRLPGRNIDLPRRTVVYDRCDVDKLL